MTDAADIPVLNIEEGISLIWESEFSEVVSTIYRRPYRLQQQGDMLGQGSMVRINIPSEGNYEGEDEDFAAWRDADATKPDDLRDWEWDLRWMREQNGLHCPLEPLVNDLHAQGILPAGRYVIHVWW